MGSNEGLTWAEGVYGLLDNHGLSYVLAGKEK
jgi:hypothetical protein